MNVNSWVGRGVVGAIALVGATLAQGQDSTLEQPRFVSIVLTRTIPSSTAELSVGAGSIDRMTDTPEGLLLEGWVSSEVDNISIVVGRAGEPIGQDVLLIARPDVAATGNALYSGFRVVFADVETDSVRCVIFNGPSGSEEMLSHTNVCVR